VILRSVKTAISIPDSVFEEAESLAQRRGMSRSELYTKAVTQLLEGERFLAVREQLDAVYETRPDESELDPVVEGLQARSVSKKRW
jgi:metal-responsive CopG/Arc/MetJ family transcriptional regulator